MERERERKGRESERKDRIRMYIILLILTLWLLGDCDSREESVTRKRLKSFNDSELEEPLRSPSRSPPDSPNFVDSDQRVFSANEVPSPEPTGVTGRITTPVDDTTQPTVKPGETSSSSSIPKPDTSRQEDEIVVEDLDVEILEAIGKRVAEDRVLAPAIPKSIAVRLEDILKKGLPKEEREKLLKAHVSPRNWIYKETKLLRVGV